MIEKTLLDYLSGTLDFGVYMEVPEAPGSTEYILIEKTGESEEDFVCRATFAIQSYADSMYRAAEINSAVKQAMDEVTKETSVTKAILNSDYNFTDTSQKKYRYQAVYELVYFRR